jgi:branched-chain amino acid transport system permease protein
LRPEAHPLDLVLFFSQVLNGLVLGSIYALIALGFSLVFGVANIINFAQGALVMLGAFFALSWLSLGLPLFIACVLAVGSAALGGILIERLALRPLRNAPYIAPLLSTLALAIILDTGAELIWSPEMQPFPSPLQAYVIFLGGAFLTGVDLLAAICAVGVTAGLWLFMYRTWTGNALRAAAQDPEAAAQMGIDVDRMRTIAFGLAGALGGLAGVLAAMYYQSAFPQMGVPFGLKGFAAALLGGLASLPGAVIGGLVLGVIESLSSGYLGEGFRDMSTYSILLLVVVFRPHGLFGSGKLDAMGGAAGASGGIPTTSVIASIAGATARVRMRSFQAPIWALVLVMACLAFLPLFGVSRYVLQVGTICAVYAMLSIGITILSGSAGVISVGQGALFGVGAYAGALLLSIAEVPVELVIVTAATVGAFVGILAAIPTLRLTGHTVALATLAFGQVAYFVFLNWLSVTRGPMGIPGVERPPVWILGNLDMTELSHQFVQALILLGIVTVFASVLVRSSIARSWRAIREDKIAARAAGLPVDAYVVIAFMVSGAISGVAGAQFAMLQNFVSPDSFILEISVVIIAMAVLGGLGNITGAVIGGVILALLPEVLREFEDYRMIAYGIILMLVLRFRPQGITGTV